jgi:hypothetical protein
MLRKTLTESSGTAAMRAWQQPDFWKSIHAPEFETSVFDRVAIAVKRGEPPRR